MMSSIDWDDFDAEGTAAEALRSKPVSKIGRVVEETQISKTTAAALLAGTVGVVGAVGGYILRG